MLAIGVILKSALIVLVFLCIAAAIRNFRGRYRYSCWRLGFALIALIPAVAVFAPQIHLPILEERPGPLAELQPSAVAVGPTGPAADNHSRETIESDAENRGTSVAAVSFLPALTDILNIIWAVGMIPPLAMIATGWVCVLLLGRSSAAVEHSGVDRIVENYRTTRGLRRKVRVVATDRIAVPITWGWRRPVIALPSDCFNGHVNDLELSLLHELEHIRRNDCLWNTLVNVCCALHWLNPLIWVAAVRYRGEREKSIDERILKRGIKPSEYAYYLVDTASRLNRTARMARGPLVVSKGSSIKERVVSVLDSAGRSRSLPRWLEYAAAGLIIVAALSLASLNFSKAREERLDPSRAAASAATGSDAGGRKLPAAIETLRFGMRLYGDEEYAEARPCFESVLARYPEYAIGRFQYAYICFRSQDFESAEQAFYDVMEMGLWEGSARFGLAFCYFSTGEEERGFHWLYRGMEVYPSSVEELKKEVEELEVAPDQQKLQSLFEAAGARKLKDVEYLYANPAFDAELEPSPRGECSGADIDLLTYVARKDADHQNRIIALSLLAAIGSPDALERVTESLLIEADPDVIEYGIYSLAAVRGADIESLLLGLCEKSRNPWIVVFAAGKLGRFLPERAAELLEWVTYTKIDHECHEDALTFLCLIPEGKGLPTVRRLAERHPSASIRAVAKDKLAALEPQTTE